MTPDDALEEVLSALRASLAQRVAVPAGDVRAVIAPYRICPLGAHIDHQGGSVLGMAIDAYSVLAFAPSADAACELWSRNFDGEVRFDFRDPGEPGSRDDGWGRYVRAAAWSLRAELPNASRGLFGEIWGALPSTGLSSSASVLLCYLSAMAAANDRSLAPTRLVELSRRCENDYVGVQSGFLDPATIAAAKRGELLRIDTANLSWESAAAGTAAPDIRFLVVFSGRDRNLTETNFNARVAETRAAAARLGELAGQGAVHGLGELSDDVFAEHAGALPPGQRRRAEHFFGERARVERGWSCWREGDTDAFGALMFESCRSSIERYETGSPELIEIQAILENTEGVRGARFSGAGFGGCSIALVHARDAEATRERVARAVSKRFPAFAERSDVRIVSSEDGLRLR